MTKRTQTKKPKLGLHDLRPHAEIICFVCKQSRPATGAVKFRSYHVCAECAHKLNSK